LVTSHSRRTTIDSEEKAAQAAARKARAAELGARLRALRGLRNYSQDDLSAITGLSRQYISELEGGKRPRPRGQTVDLIAIALGVTPEQLRGAAPLAVPGSPARPAPAGGAERSGITWVLPPGATVIERREPDGTIVLHIRVPPAPPDCHGGASPDAPGDC
jgi:transcriptional regulator with XRE-family HTH domain